MTNLFDPIFHVRFAGVLLSVLALFHDAPSLFYASELVTPSPLARGVLLSLTAFWLCRLAFQFFVYDASLWRGQPFETRMHWLFSALWFYLTIVFGGALWRQF